MTKNKFIKLLVEKTFVQLILASVFFCTTLIISTIIGGSSEVQALPTLQLSGAGQAVVDNSITELLNGDTIGMEDKTVLFTFPAECELYQKEDAYYIRTLHTKEVNQMINTDYPLIMDNGAYLYLYHNSFLLVTDDFNTVEANKDTSLSDGMIFNQQRQREGDQNIILLKLPNGLFINIQELLIENDGVLNTIERNSIIRLNETGISYFSLLGNKPSIGQVTITDPMAMISYSEQRLTYDVLFEKINSDRVQKDEEDLAKYHLDSDIYQYFLGNRYDYQGEKVFFRANEGYFMELNENRFFLINAPLYYTKEQKLLLPCDYVLIQPKLFMMNKLSAMTEITYKNSVVYTLWNEKLRSYMDSILFDGADTYLFFDDTELTWGDENIAISPLSSVYVGEDGSIEIYKYDTKEYTFYNVDGYQEVLATVDKEISINLSNDILYRPDGQEQILFSHPSLLKNAE